MFDSRSARLLAVLALAAAALLIGGSLMTTGDDAARTETASRPSYEALRPLLRDGAGKEDDQGQVEVFQVGNPHPAAWIKVLKVPGTGVSETWIVKHESYVAGEEGTYESVDGPGPVSLPAFLAWIVETYGHVEDVSQLSPEPLG